MFNPKVSILIPLYNSEKYISETIESCLNQVYNNIEIIIVDDGSTDKGLEIVKDYEEQYKNILVDTQKNSGAPVARNKAFLLSTGSYIQYLDADDLLHPEKIQLQIDVLKSAKERAMVFGKWGTFEKQIENVSWKDLPVNKDHDNPVEFLITLWANWISVVTHAWLVPRELVTECYGWDESLIKNQDGDFFARLAMKSSKLIFVEKSMVYYRKDNKNSITKQVSKETLEANLKTFEKYKELMKDDIDKPEVRKSLALMYSKFIDYVRFTNSEYVDVIENAEVRIRELGYKKPLITKTTITYRLINMLGSENIRRIKRTLKKIMKA